MTYPLSIAGKTIAETTFTEDQAVFTFDDGSSLRIYARVSGGCCCCGDGYLSYEDDAPMYGPEPPPPPPQAVAFWREGEHAVTIRSIVQVPLLAGLGWRVVFTLDGGSELHRYFAPLNHRPPDEFIDALPVSARLSVKPKTTWDRLEDINAGREPDKQSYTFTFDVQET